jgi:hypothetical protein
LTRIIPNENTFIGFAITCADMAAPKASEVASSVDLTGYCLSINASTTGNTVPTPALDSLFETSIAGTVQGSFTADFYRDDEDDLAWETLPRKSKGYMFISRFGGSSPNGTMPISGDDIEVWPILVVSRTMAANGSNTVMTFTVTASIPEEPEEDGVVGT